MLAEPQRFAAAVPMSGSGSTGAAASVSSLPFWFFHAANDGTVSVSGSDNIVAALRDAGDNVIYTRYDTGGHGIWSVAYTHPQLFAWLVSQQRGAPGTLLAPVINITQPTDADAWTTGADQIDLAGDANNDGDPIDSIAWTTSGGASGAAIGEASWTANAIPLDMGENLVRITASTATLHPAGGGATTFNDHLRVTRNIDRIFVDGFDG